MYYPCRSGSVEIIQGYECQLPNVGWGKNRITGELERVGVIKRSERPENQWWERIELPEDYEAKRKIEERKQQSDPEYFDPELEKIRLQHWKYRLCGVWIYINGKPVYIPPSYYYYLNWCQIDIGYPQYRDTDRKYYYVWEYCVEDPRCAGMVDIERRRQGKSYKSGSIALDRTSIYNNHHAGIQSKTAEDAKALFKKTIVSFFKKIPHFFRPTYDQSKGMTPTSELRFFKTTVKGKRAEEVLEGDELESWVDYGSAEVYHYDGTKLNTYISDEFGKMENISAWGRWNVVRWCLDQDGAWCGKALFTSTIEDMEGGDNDAYRIWQASDPSKRDANGRTESGMYRFFLPAYETTYFDKYGMPEIDKAKEFYLNQREGLKHDPRALSSLIRKAPFTIEEAFRIDATICLYNPEKLNMRLEWLLANYERITERGNFVWKDGGRLLRTVDGVPTKGEVLWQPNRNGRWIMGKKLRPGDTNRVNGQSGDFSPGAQFTRVAGGDPFKYDKTKTNIRSNYGAYVFDMVENRFLCEYIYRAPTTDMANEDMLLMCWYYGAGFLGERNVEHWIKYFERAGCARFLVRIPGEQMPGVFTDGKGSTLQQLCQLTEAYIEQHIDNVDFPRLVEGWLNFKIDDTTAFDGPMGAGMALIGAEYRRLKKKPEESQEKDKNDISNYFRKRVAI